MKSNNSQIHGESLNKFRSNSSRKKWGGAVSIFGIFILIFFGWLLYNFNKISDPNQKGSPILKFFDQVDVNNLAGEGDGRINILLLGSDVNNLTDTIITASVDPINKKLALISLPRDLRVKTGNNAFGKINSVYSGAERREEGSGPQAIKSKVEEILGVPVHYFVKVDFQGLVKLVDEVGGITVDVPKALNDPFYPNEKLGYDPFSIDAGVQQLDGDTALKYARSRQTTSDFDRAARQQLVLLAIKEKALSLGTLSNPAKLTGIINILGNHVRMDLSLSELQRLFELVKDIQIDDITNQVIDNSPTGPLKSINDSGYYLVPKTGDYKEIQRIAQNAFQDPYIVRENATIEIVDATGSKNKATNLLKDLKNRGYNIVEEISKAEEVSPNTEIYDFSKGRAQFTVKFLETKFGVTAIKSNDKVEVEIQIILGEDYAGE